ncbi:hypothetical protein AOLI_G00282670 [Acnodon oligacanthus]
MRAEFLLHSATSPGVGKHDADSAHLCGQQKDGISSVHLEESDAITFSAIPATVPSTLSIRRSTMSSIFLDWEKSSIQ